MDSWLSLIPGPRPETRDVTPTVVTEVESEEWDGARQRLISKQWHRYAADISGPVYLRDPEIYEVAAAPTPWTEDDLAWALHVSRESTTKYDGRVFHLPVIIASQLSVEQLAPFEPVLRAVLADVSERWGMPTDIRRPLAARYGEVLARLGGGLPAHLLPERDGFGVTTRRRLGGLAADPAVIAALEFADTLAKPAPTKTWLRQAEQLVAASPAVPSAVTTVLATFTEEAGPLDDFHDQLLRGLVWMAAADPGDEATALIARVAQVAGEPYGRGAYARASRTAASAVEAVADRPGDAPAAALARLAVTCRSKPLRVRVRDALDRLGAARGWAPGEALELTVETHDIDRHGDAVEIVGDKAKALSRTGEAKTLVKALNKTLGLERARLEDLLAHDRTWKWETWVERYARHPITGTVARRLLWQVSADGREWTTGLPEAAGDEWRVGGAGGAGWVVRLWHPVLADAAEVAAWRDTITTAGIRQPFKQAFREVYRLTPAEEQTRAYSNRFAGHILRYRQANALMRVRNWSASYLGTWDGGYHSEAVRELAAGTWQASFRHEIAGEVEAPSYTVEHCSTDQVRFAVRAGRRWEPVPVTDVPARVLSEAMRDVDLFVGVTSIAADDTWADRGEHPFGMYWQTAGFGALTGSAEVRRDVLARLLPRLAIGSKCELTDRFLRVRGSRATYKIHLGSGNILMEPNDAYLCIVPAGRSARVSLPFDDDERLSLILSKAFLLAADEKITDATILRQLPRPA
ncbi:DUF4132 domain-containing protein [Actinoplanes sp. LDG1-06]|uniref:DUF4132 domain-containing protein n=1 Tax=Paractinoplanes ovalisporus TaxID=2810368 RepID=A0ABS2AT86_9ACTN|nr:DUF4132 domain-containing protein [Actinoplanes ovalisporus]MBM2622960.1 DUF4132 domain-containing protein [Actinoplanes ovalisporus]